MQYQDKCAYVRSRGDTVSTLKSQPPSSLAALLSVVATHSSIDDAFLTVQALASCRAPQEMPADGARDRALHAAQTEPDDDPRAKKNARAR